MGIKLEDHNYALWSQVMQIYIAGKNKLRYILGDTTQHEPTDPAFWKVENQKYCCQGMAHQLNVVIFY